MFTLKYYWVGQTAKLPMGSLLAACRSKDQVRQVIHGPNIIARFNWRGALESAREHLFQRLSCMAWGALATSAWCFLAAAILWWIPFTPADFHPLYLCVPPTLIGVVMLANVLRAWVTRRRVTKLVRTLMDGKPPMPRPFVPPPASLYALESPKSSLRLRAVISIAVLIIFILGPGQWAIPLPLHPVRVYHPAECQTTCLLTHSQATTSPTRIPLGMRWQYVSSEVTGRAYGLIYHDSTNKRVLVLDVQYRIANDELYPAANIRARMESAVSYMSNNVAQYAQAQIPGGLSGNAALRWMETQFTLEDTSGLDDAFRRYIDEGLDGRCLSISVEARVMSVAAYQEYLRR